MASSHYHVMAAASCNSRASRTEWQRLVAGATSGSLYEPIRGTPSLGPRTDGAHGKRGAPGCQRTEECRPIDVDLTVAIRHGLADVDGGNRGRRVWIGAVCKNLEQVARHVCVMVGRCRERRRISGCWR